jgi:membrane protease subunit HflC
VEIDQLEVATADHSQMVLDAFLHYRIEDPRRFYLALGGVRAADERLHGLLASSLRRALGAVSLADIVTGRQDTVMRKAVDDLRLRTASASLGVEVLDAGLRHADLPASEAEAVYRRMRAAGAQQAAQIRADGEQRKTGVVADADRQVAAIRGDAEAQALKINGEGDAQRIAVLGAAYGRDPAFARFFRQMEAYQNTLAQGDATLVLSPDNAFMRDFARGPTGR